MLLILFSYRSKKSDTSKTNADFEVMSWNNLYEVPQRARKRQISIISQFIHLKRIQI